MLAINKYIPAISLFFLAVVVSLAVQPVLAGSHHGEAKTFHSEPVTNEITMLQGKGGNIAVLKGEEGLLLVDTDYGEMSDALKKTLETMGGLDAVTYVINTYWHGDHSEGNQLLGHHATIVAHENVRTRLLAPQALKIFNMTVAPFEPYAAPSITYKKALSLYFADEEVMLVHFGSGHTDGDSVVFFNKANVVHTGDHFFNGFFPFVDIQNGGNVLQMAANVRQLLRMIDENTKVIPGHGPLSNKQELQVFHDMLIATTKEVQAMMKKGMNLEEMKKTGLSKRWQPWGTGFINESTWIQIIKSSL